MVDEVLSGGGSAASICPWCSAMYMGEPERCPSCNATLTGDAAADPALPGLTAIDAVALARSKEPARKSRSRLLSWISGEYPDEGPDKVDSGAVAPPDQAVRLEILKLELAAQVASLQAEADAMRADDMIDGRSVAATTHDDADEDAGAASEDAPTDDVLGDEPAAAADGRSDAAAAADGETDPVEDAPASA